MHTYEHLDTAIMHDTCVLGGFNSVTIVAPAAALMPLELVVLYFG
jgi:hypothetical protein